MHYVKGTLQEVVFGGEGGEIHSSSYNSSSNSKSTRKCNYIVSISILVIM